jgi:tight adherence protein B
MAAVELKALRRLLSPQLVLLAAVILGLGSVAISLRVASKSRLLIRQQEAWPAFIDTLASTLSAGTSPTEAIELACAKAPKVLTAGMPDMMQELNNRRLRDALPRLKAAYQNAQVDEFVKIFTLNEDLGGIGMVPMLKQHATRARAYNAASAQARAKRSATLTIAKLGVAAPWILLALLLSRAESAESFATPAGTSILLGGLAVCVVAYRLVAVLGAPRAQVRVYAKS